MLKKLLTYHFIPFTIACAIVFAIVYLSSPLRYNKNQAANHEVIGEQ
jgi:hypothetical protein